MNDRSPDELHDAGEDEPPDDDRQAAHEQRVEAHADPVVPMRRHAAVALVMQRDEHRAHRHLCRDLDEREHGRTPDILVQWEIGEMRRHRAEQKDRADRDGDAEVQPVVQRVREDENAIEPQQDAGDDRHLGERE